MESLGDNRQLLACLALLTETTLMYDLTADLWAEVAAEVATTVPAARRLSKRLSSREKAFFISPAKADGYVEKRESKSEECRVRERAVECVGELLSKYSAEFVDWIDTACGTEKQALLLRIKLEGGKPALLVAFRGSKAFHDWVTTDVSSYFLPLHERVIAVATGAAQPSARHPAPCHVLGPLAEEPEELNRAAFMPLLKNSARPAVTRGMWRAYAGAKGRTRAGESPRARVRRAVESERKACPELMVLTTGHSLGGAVLVATV